MFAWVYWLGKQIKEWFFTWINSLIRSKTDSRGWDKFSIEFLHISLNFDSHLIQRINLIGTLNLIHKLINFGSSFLSWFDCGFRYLGSYHALCWTYWMFFGFGRSSEVRSKFWENESNLLGEVRQMTFQRAILLITAAMATVELMKYKIIPMIASWTSINVASDTCQIIRITASWAILDMASIACQSGSSCLNLCTVLVFIQMIRNFECIHLCYLLFSCLQTSMCS